MTPHSSWFAAFLAGLGNIQVNGDPAVFVGLNGDRFDAVCPTQECFFLEVAGSVIGMHTRCMEDF